ncbi:MAG: hypothetical protein ACTHMT_15435 [Verrucomicrobiota bacterium]
MSAVISKDQAIVPAVHLEFIQNQASLPEEAGVEEVEKYHRALFLHHHAGELEEQQQQRQIHERRLLYLESRLQDAQTRLGSLEKLVPVTIDGEADTKPSSPWNTWDAVMFASAGLAILSLIVFGILNISFNLLESGLVTFIQSPIRAYFWAALLPVGALAVKAGWDFLQSTRSRNIYLWSCLGIGIVGVLAWVAAYAAVYPTLSRSVSETIQTLSVFDQPANSQTAFSPGGAKWVDVITVAAQALAEIFLSAVLGIYMTIIYARHRVVRLAGNPLFMQLDKERAELETVVARERLSLAEARGKQARLESQLTALVAYARSVFQKESALKRDQAQQKRVLLDQISEQLRSQLDTMENRGGLLRNNAATLTSGNGK